MNNNNMVVMATAAERVFHWMFAISCLLLTLTGFAFLFKNASIAGVFGGFESMKSIHNWLGIVFIISLLMSSAKWLKHPLRFDADDIRWMAVAGGYLSHKVKVPPMGKLNTGQKISYVGVLLSGILLTASGFVLWFFPELKTWFLLSFIAHNLSFLFICIFIPMHIYLGTIGNPGTFQIMTSGRISYKRAKNHYPKWVAEMETGKKVLS
ncbi:MAG: formate dehydrogenase subunit gamma [Nitrospiraceae bacterium]|nr:formate dehydrogenase subunit gamma [Nitrospiraceae bacterium]